MGTYINSADLVAIFGASRITDTDGWADLDNDGDSTKITARITESISYAEEYIESYLRGSRITVPISATGSILKTIIATIAGEWLYKCRGFQDGDPERSKVGALLQRSEKLLKQIRNGQLRLNVNLSHNEATAPVVL